MEQPPASPPRPDTNRPESPAAPARRLIVVGGGITGLSAAYTALKTARETDADLEVRLYEQAPALGGKLVTRDEDGFRIEGGPDSFITQKPWALDLCRDLGLDDELLPCNSEGRNVYISSNRELLPLPDGFRLTVPTNIAAFLRSPLLSWRGKARAMAEPFIPARAPDEDESLADFVTRRFGREMVERIAGPLMAGIFVSDPDTLSMACSFPRFLDMERRGGSLTRSFMKQKKAAAGHPRPPVFKSLKTGMGRLAQALIREVGDAARPGIGVEAVTPDPDGSGYRLRLSDGREDAGDAIILAIPAAASARLLETVHPVTAGVLQRFTTVSTATVSLGFHNAREAFERPLDGFGFVVPPEDPCRLLACTWSSVKFPGRAPDGGALVRAFIGGVKSPERAEWPDEKLLSVVRDELASTMGLRAAPDVTAIYRWPHANPQYPVGHAGRVASIERDLAAHAPGLFLAGSPYHGVGIPDCIHSAQRAVRHALQSASPGHDGPAVSGTTG